MTQKLILIKISRMAMASRKNLFKLKYQEWFGKVIIIKLGKRLNVFDKLKSDCN